MRLSSDFYWETDAAHRLRRLVEGAAEALPKEAWAAPAPTMEARLPFRDLQFSRGHATDQRYYRLSGEPVYDAG